MNKIIIKGGNTIEGKVWISSAKNSALTVMAAAVLPYIEGAITIENYPSLTDVYALAESINDLGASCIFNDTSIVISGPITNNSPSSQFIKKTRASSLLIAPLISTFSEVYMPFSGGCSIGPRPINFHLEALEKMGISVKITNEVINLQRKERLKGVVIHFSHISVGATANILMCAIFAQGKTLLSNVALEPEIQQLITFLNKCGAKIEVLSKRRLSIEGVIKLKGGTVSLIPDRIEAATYAIAAAITKGYLTLQNVIVSHLQNILKVLQQITECEIVSLSNNSIIIKNIKAIVQPASITTNPYPGFPTDIQAQFMALLTLCSGTSIIKEHVFPQRFNHAYELNKLGANISITEGTATIKGVKELTGGDVQAHDLRGGAALLLAGLVAKGSTTIENAFYIERGYENFIKKFTECNAEIQIQ